jgi:predicted nucleotidyltransferase
MTEATVARAGPRIDHPDELDRMVRQIVAKVDPVAIYLFGSRARGDADDDSDYDLMIVVPDDFPDGQAHATTAFSLVDGRRIPMDVTMSRATGFATRRRQIGTLEYKVGREGIVLHERHNRS